MEAIISKVDLTKVDRSYYSSQLEPEVVDLDSYYYLTLSGKCAPEDPRFTSAIETIYAVAFRIKFLCKGEDNDFVVPKMECKWFIDGGLEAQHGFTDAPRNEWCWKIHFRMPDFVEEDHFNRALIEAKNQKPEKSNEFDQVQFELINEGRCVQIMPIGSWDAEGPSLEKVFDLINAEGFKVTGYHKEIYLSDPMRVEEAKKKTILRYQVN